MGIEHYENFPVGSILLPKRLRQPVHAVYRFARTADDIADEGGAIAEDRQGELAALVAELDRLAAGKRPETVLMQQLSDEAIAPYALPLQPFYDLLSAFSQDVVKKRYDTFDEVLDYCRRSANPVGRLMLSLYGADSENNVLMADAICSALQLINFWQDIAIDWRKDRVYLPQEDLNCFCVSEEQIAQGLSDDQWCKLMQFQVDRTRSMLTSGAPLGSILKGRIGLELRMIVNGGARILQKLEACEGDVFHHRPVLSKCDWAGMFWSAL